MSYDRSAVITGVGIALLTGVVISSFNMYTDVQLLKVQTAALEVTMKEREETTKRFTEMMYQMDKTVAVQAEATNALKEAVNRLEERNGIVYLSPKENKIDR